MLKTLRRRVDAMQARLTDPAALEATLGRLVADGSISSEQAAVVRAALPSQIDGSRYILGHLGAHLVIGAVFAFDVVPLPFGTIARVSWVAGNRVIESARRARDRARIHSVGVLLIAAVPWLGYSAYLLPLRRRSTELAFVLANRLWLSRTGRTYERLLAETHPSFRRFGRWWVPLPAPERGPRARRHETEGGSRPR